MAVPSSCPSCTTAIPTGRSRCPGCGRVFGEENRCPHCLAHAAVRPSGVGYVCMACSQPREVFPGTVVQGGNTALPMPVAGGSSLVPKVQSVAAHGGAVGLQLFGAFATFGALGVGGIVGLLVGGVPGALAAGAIGALGVGVGALAFVFGRRIGRRATRLSATSRELDILALADRHGGELYTTDVARALGTSSVEAEAALAALVDGSRVVADVTREGLVKYVFREVRPLPGPRVRIAAPEEPAEHELEPRHGAGRRETDA